MRTRSVCWLAGAALLLGLAWFGWLSPMSKEARAAGPLVADGDFEIFKKSSELRAFGDGESWYESRNRKGPGAARRLLMLSRKKIGGNGTQKAMIKAHPEYNTYLSNRFTDPQGGGFSLQWDIYVKEIEKKKYNRSAFQMIGDTSVEGRGPNASGKERFVFLAFENAGETGKINLFAFEGKDKKNWDVRTPVVEGLSLKKWYTVRVDVDPGKGRYQVSIPGVTQSPVELKAFRFKGAKHPKKLTHVSFASWNDGPGTFYVDNVRQP